MNREFFDAESQRITVVFPPDAESFATIGGESNERSLHTFADNVAALAGYVEYVRALLADGALELAPWITMARGEEEIAVRPPVTPRLEVRTHAGVEATDYDTLLEAIHAYNEFAGQRLRDGWACVLPRSADFAPSEAFEQIVVHDPDSPDLIQKTYYQRKAQPQDEFGPEVWHRDGVPYMFNFQVQTEVAGAKIQLKGDALRGIQTFHDGLAHGPTIIFDAESGSIKSHTLYTGADGKRRTLIFEEGRLLVEAPDGSTHDGKNRGVWTKYEDDGRLENLFDPPDRRRWFKSYDTEGTLVSAGEFDDDGQKVGTWIDTDSENRITTVYREPGTHQSITWDRLDGTLELYKEFDEDGRNSVITFHSDDGRMNERRDRLDGDAGWQSECYHADTDTVSERAILDVDGRYHGVRTRYDASAGIESQTTYIHGEEAVGGVDPNATPIEAVFACLEATSPATGPYVSVSANAHPHLLEDHLARLYCVATKDIAKLSTTGGGWTHRSQAGSAVKIARRKGGLVGATVLRADGTLAAEARYLPHAPGPYVAPHVHVTLYHTDGVSAQRAGTYRAEFPWDDRDNVHCTREGWWFDHSAQGLLSRAQGFTQRSEKPAADYKYAFDFDDERPQIAFADLCATARALAEEAPTRENFLALCKAVEQASVTDRERAANELVPHLCEAIADWPARIRMAPWLWINRLTATALPIEAIALVSGLSLTAAMTGHYLSNRQYPLLLAWLAAYPEDGPAPSGISISMRDSVADALGAACESESHARYHPACDLVFDETYHINSEDYAVLFGSSLMRNVRVLDASWDPTSHDFYWDYQGILDGRGLRVGDIMDSLRSEKLEVLDLWGQTSNCRNQVAQSGLSKRATLRLANLHALNLGGGHPIGAEAAKQLAAACPSLRALSLWPGQAAAALSGYDFDHAEDEDVYRSMSAYWNIYDNDHIESLRLTKSSWQALAKLPLARVDLGAVHADHAFGDKVAVQLRSFYRLREGPRIAAWENHFESV